MDDSLEDIAWIVWCGLLSALIFYILVQTVKYCAKITKSRGILNPDGTPERTENGEDFTAVSPVYTISRTLPSIDTLTTTASSRELASTTTCSRNTLNIDTEKLDGLPSYEEAIQIMMHPSAPISPPGRLSTTIITDQENQSQTNHQNWFNNIIIFRFSDFFDFLFPDVIAGGGGGICKIVEGYCPASAISLRTIKIYRKKLMLTKNV
uniref:CSON009587 protein n=1 Tax=Culicoides sonorensis TaxID=179676 RepID=A0A336KJG1_CULSO